jgi:hypothetical protein
VVEVGAVGSHGEGGDGLACEDREHAAGDDAAEWADPVVVGVAADRDQGPVRLEPAAEFAGCLCDAGLEDEVVGSP